VRKIPWEKTENDNGNTRERNPNQRINRYLGTQIQEFYWYSEIVPSKSKKMNIWRVLVISIIKQILCTFPSHASKAELCDNSHGVAKKRKLSLGSLETLVHLPSSDLGNGSSVFWIAPNDQMTIFHSLQWPIRWCSDKTSRTKSKGHQSE